MKKNQFGFSLLEVMIVLTILGTLTVLTSQSIQNAVKSKVKIDYTNEDMGRVRDALKIIQRDVELTFHYNDLEMEMRDLIKEKRKALFAPNNNNNSNNNANKDPSTTTTTTLPNSNAPVFNPNDPMDPLNQKNPNRIDPVTQFVGTEDKLYFATLNNSRISEANPSADFVKVGYELAKCKKPGSDKDSQCIIRKLSPIVEGDVTKGGENTVLLEDVVEFKLRYLGKDKQDWISDWNTVNGDPSTKNKFPDAVEVSVKTEKADGKKKKSISMQLMIPIRFPNNIEKKKSSALDANGNPVEAGAAGATPPQDGSN